MQDDRRYLDGTVSPLESYWVFGRQAHSRSAEAPAVAFRDDFVSVAAPRLASADGPGGIQAAIRKMDQEAHVVDSRLFRRVTLAQKNASLEDVCARLQQLTGVRITAAPGVVDEKVTVFVTAQPARDVLRAMARMFGYIWERSGDEGAYIYRFKQPLRAQLAEEDLRSRDQHEAFLALDEEMQKIQAQGQRHHAWWAASIYNHLSPADRAALVNGETLHFTPNAANPDRSIAAEMRLPMLKTFDLHLLEDQGARHISTGAMPGEEDRGPLAEIPNAMPAVEMRIDGSELGVYKLHAHEGGYLVGDANLGQPFYMGWLDPLAVGRSASRQELHNADDNRAAQNLPLFRQKLTLKPRSSCAARETAVSADTMQLHVDEGSGKVVEGPDGPHVFAGDVWEAIHRQTGANIVADSYLKVYPQSAVTLGETTLFDALCRAGDAMHIRWKKDGDFLLCRSADYVWNKLKEVPNRPLQRWLQDRQSLGYLPLADFLEMATLSDQQLDAVSVGKVMQHCLGFEEWGLIGKGGFRAGFVLPEVMRGYARFFAALPDNLRDAALQPEGVPLVTLPQEAQRMLIELQSRHGSADLQALAGMRIHCDYVPAGHYYWQPLVTQEQARAAEKLPVVCAADADTALKVARQFKADVDRDQIKRSQGLFALAFHYANGASNRVGLNIHIMVPTSP